MRDFLGSFHNFLLLLPPLLSNSLPADLGTARLLTLESDIKEVQEKWRQYRNIVTDGFFLNDSMIVLADFFGGQQNRREENDVDYHHYFSFQDYTTDSGAPQDIRGLEIYDIGTNKDSQENSVDDIVGQKNAATSENIKTDPALVVAHSMTNDTEDEWNDITQVSNIETVTTKGNIELSKMEDDDESLYGRPVASEQLASPPDGKGGGNGTMDDVDRVEQMENGVRNSLEPVEGDGKGLEQVEMDGKGLE